MGFMCLYLQTPHSTVFATIEKRKPQKKATFLVNKEIYERLMYLSFIEVPIAWSVH